MHKCLSIQDSKCCSSICPDSYIGDERVGSVKSVQFFKRKQTICVDICEPYDRIEGKITNPLSPECVHRTVQYNNLTELEDIKMNYINY